MHAGLSAGVLGLTLWFSPLWLSLFAALVLSAVLGHIFRGRPRGELLATPQAAGGTRWSWRERPSSTWQEVTLRYDYLGPWLIGLRLDGRRLWVWPDSCDASSRRALRRELVTLP